MLVLSRRHGQRVVVGENVVVTIVSLRGNRVRIGIEAPSDISVARQEVWTESNESSSFGTNHDQLDL